MTDPSAASIVSSIWKIIPQFYSHSIPRTIEFYTETLHFKLGGAHPPENLNFCSLFTGKKAAANIYFFQCNEADAGNTFQESAANIAMGTNELDQYFELLQSSGKVEIVEPIEDKPWGYRQFSIKDPDGNRLTFFRFLTGGNPGPEDVKDS